MIFEAKEEDVPQVAAIEKELFSMPWSENGFLEAVCNPSAFVWIYKEDERILGYLVMYTYIDEGEITNVAVVPEARNRGIGSALVKHAIAYAKKEAFRQIVLEVRKSNQSAIGVYETCGFVLLGERKNFYEKPREDAMIMAWQEN